MNDKLIYKNNIIVVKIYKWKSYYSYILRV